MSAVQYIAGTVMDSAAALMNDTAKSIYTYVVQAPYLDLAMKEIEEYFQLNDIPVTHFQSFPILVKAGKNKINYNETPAYHPEKLPSTLIEPQLLWERMAGSLGGYTPMTKVNVLPINMEGISTNTFGIYTWENEEITVFPATCDIEVRMDYVAFMFYGFPDENTLINFNHLQSYLSFRTAALCAEFIGENKTRADDLNNYASLAMDRAIGIGTKGRQSIMTRRRPFRQGFKKTVQF